MLIVPVHRLHKSAQYSRTCKCCLCPINLDPQDQKFGGLHGPLSLKRFSRHLCVFLPFPSVAPAIPRLQRPAKLLAMRRHQPSVPVRSRAPSCQAVSAQAVLRRSAFEAVAPQWPLILCSLGGSTLHSPGSCESVEFPGSIRSSFWDMHHSTGSLDEVCLNRLWALLHATPRPAHRSSDIKK